MTVFSRRHGDIIYVSYVEAQQQQEQDQQEANAANIDVKQDEVDNFLEKQRGLIDRPKDQRL
jgi:nuclear protein localization family protein 4